MQPGYAAAAWSFMQLQNDQVLLIYTRITCHLAIAYMHFNASNAIADMMHVTTNFNYLYLPVAGILGALCIL